jgi:GNAT superfamily N-acetyltransferase
VADFKDAAARFLFAYGPAKSEDEDKPVIAVCHFRLTLAGELQNEMQGDPVLLVADMFVAPEAQRKGLGSHMLNLCQLIARGNSLTGVMVGMYTALARSAEPWLLKKQRGFELDVTWTPDADSGITAYFKPAVVAKAAASPASPAAAAICAPAASSPDSVLSASASAASPASPAAAPEAAREAAPGVALAAQFEKVSVQEDVPFWQRVTVPAAPAETVESASESEEDDDDEESEDDDERAERILDELATMFEERHGRPPTADEVEQWKATLNEASAEAAAAESR